MNNLPDWVLLRLKQIIGDLPIPPIIPNPNKQIGLVGGRQIRRLPETIRSSRLEHLDMDSR